MPSAEFVCNNFLLHKSSAEVKRGPVIRVELIQNYSSINRISAFGFIDFWYSQKIGSILITIRVSTFEMS